MAKAGQHTLKITVQSNDKTVEIRLEGRIAGPWIEELRRVWVETAPLLDEKGLLIDLRNVTYADAGGKGVLRDIYTHTPAKFVTNSPWAQYLAEEIMQSQTKA